VGQGPNKPAEEKMSELLMEFVDPPQVHAGGSQRDHQRTDGRKDKNFSLYDKVIVHIELTMTSEAPPSTLRT
jgi:hypothetical protein